jgi:transcription elongation factor Elf1
VIDLKCLACGTEFIIKRTLKNLFDTKMYYCCDRCIRKYQFKINHSYIPLDKHELIIISLFEKDHKIDYQAFNLEYGQIYKRLFELEKEQIIIMYDKVFLTSIFIRKFNEISTLLDKNIYILTNVLMV